MEVVPEPQPVSTLSRAMGVAVSLCPPPKEPDWPTIEAGHRFVDQFGVHFSEEFHGVLPAARSSQFQWQEVEAFKKALRHRSARKGWAAVDAFETLPGSLQVRYLDLALQHASQTLTFSVWILPSRFDELAADGIVKGFASAIKNALQQELGRAPNFWFAVCSDPISGTNPLVSGAVAASPAEHDHLVRALRALRGSEAARDGFTDGLRVSEPYDIASWGRAASIHVDVSERVAYGESVVGCTFDLSFDASSYIHHLKAIEQGKCPLGPQSAKKRQKSRRTS